MIVSGSINQTLLVYAFAHADASTLAPFTYFEIVSAVIFGYLFFDTLPFVMIAKNSPSVLARDRSVW